MVLILVIALMLIIGFGVVKVVFDLINENRAGLVEGVPEAEAVMNRMDTYTMPMLDKFFIASMIGGYIGIFILAYFLKGHPAFLPVMFIMTIIVIMISVFVSNTHEEVLKAGVLGEAISTFTMSNYFLSHLPAISFIYTIALIIIMLSFGLGGE